MGIRGLTTFIQSRSHLYMDNYELHDTNLVIDRNSIACQIYRWHCPGANDCFGGDYDRYGKVVVDFFQLLFDCNVTPYVVFDGGYENKKVATVISRMKNKVSTAAALDSTTEGSYLVFPLFLRECFKEIVDRLGVKKVRCDFEADSETATIARILNCPVLSYDSDYFVFNVLYIPFKTFEFKTRLKKIGNSKDCVRYISCELYRVEKFLNSYGGMDKENLPILAVLLGNDYVRRSVFTLFFQNLKIQKCNKNQNEQQRRIKSLIVWLQNETKESAINKVLSRYKKYNRQRVFDKIQKAIQGYYCTNSEYLQYLDIEFESKEVPEIIDVTNFIDDIDASVTDDEYETDVDVSSSEEIVNSLTNVQPVTKVQLTEPFLEKFRKCVYPPCFMDISFQNKYYCIPQVENISLNHAHSVSLDILSALHKILTNSSNNLTCITRTQNTQIGKVSVPICEKSVPNFLEIECLSEKDRQNVLLDILELRENVIDISFPKTWHLFILSIKYLTNKSKLSWPMIYSLILCKIMLEYLDKKVGYYRKKKNFDKKFSTSLKTTASKNSSDVENCISEVLLSIPQSEAIHALSIFLTYFEIEEKMKTHRRSFDRNLVHSLSEFQSCLLHFKYLNCLLNYPLSDVIIYQTLNCTFIYNFTSNLKKRASCDSYLEVLLKESPTVHKAVQIIVNRLKDSCDSISAIKSTSKKKRKKKKKHPENVELPQEVVDENCHDEIMYDPCNKFSILLDNKIS